MQPSEIREQLQLDKLTEKTDNLCGESNEGRSELEQSIKLHSLGSIGETSLTSHRTPSTSAYVNIHGSFNATRKQNLVHEESAKTIPEVARRNQYFSASRNSETIDN